MARSARTNEVARACLLHDAHEALVGVVGANWKEFRWCLPYVKTEERLTEAMAERFGLPYPFAPEVRRLDLRARRSEVDAYLPHALETVKGLRPLTVSLDPAWSPARARAEFLAEARRLGHEPRQASVPSQRAPRRPRGRRYCKFDGDNRQPVGLHDLRHSYVALALARHANAKVTAQVYAGITEHGREAAAAKLVDAGFGA